MTEKETIMELRAEVRALLEVIRVLVEKYGLKDKDIEFRKGEKK